MSSAGHKYDITRLEMIISIENHKISMKKFFNYDICKVLSAEENENHKISIRRNWQSMTARGSGWIENKKGIVFWINKLGNK